MVAIPAGWSARVCCAVALLMIITANSCDKEEHVAGGGDGKDAKSIKCDTAVTVNQKSVAPNSVYLCLSSTMTWSKAGNVDKFSVDFHGHTPFSDSDGDQFDDQKPSHPGQQQYGALDVFKYSISITSGTKTTILDPQVVAGGNP